MIVPPTTMEYECGSYRLQSGHAAGARSDGTTAGAARIL